MESEQAALASTVQKNCHISDALYARDYSLCIYLLKMREYFRWERGYGYAASLPEDELGQWLVKREQLWQELEEESYAPLVIGGREFLPFESASVNEALRPHGLVYSGGLGGSAKPLFFLAELEQERHLGERRVLIAGREFARDITAPPAMTLGDTIYVRRESLRRMLWERLEEWRWRRQDTPMGRAAGHYDFEQAFDASLDAMADAEIESVVLHEQGEVEAGCRLGEGWERMLSAFARTRAEFMARAARDHLADCLATLPVLLEQDRQASLHFYFANLTGLRKALFPALVKAYETWHGSGNREELEQVVAQGAQHWLSVCGGMLEAHEHGEPTAHDLTPLAL